MPAIAESIADAWLPEQAFDTLRRKWGTVPAAIDNRVSTASLLQLPDDELRTLWEAELRTCSTGDAYSIRGWYHDLYRDVLRGKRVLDVGAGLGFDAFTFARAGAHVTMLDIVPDNVELHRRLAKLFGLESSVDHLYMADLSSLDALPRGGFDVIWAQGSLINMPFELVREEVQLLLRHLKIGGRWIELAYPRQRWEREGRMPLDQWGEKTDGPGTPYMDWYDLDKLRAALSPAELDTVLAFNFRDDEFNWFDLVRRS